MGGTMRSVGGTSLLRRGFSVIEESGKPLPEVTPNSSIWEALLLEWRNGKTCCHACFTEYGKIEIFFKNGLYVHLIQIASSAIGFQRRNNG